MNIKKEEKWPDNGVRKFNEFCGIAKMKIEDKDVFVVYDHFLEGGFELGHSAGKGSTVEEALINSVMNLNRLMRNIYDALEEDKRVIKQIEDEIWYRDKENILPVKGCDCESGEEYIENAAITFGRNGYARIRSDNFTITSLGR